MPLERSTFCPSLENMKSITILLAITLMLVSDVSFAQERPKVGVAFGGGGEGHLTWRVDTHDSATIPSRGTLAHATFSYVFQGPSPTVDDVALPTARSSVRLPQLAGEANRFWRKGERTWLFVLGGAGTSFHHQPLLVDQFPLGWPLHLGAYSVGEIRGDHYAIATAGLVRELGRMPDFLGGPIFAGAWVENGDAFDTGTRRRCGRI